jgi:hypothetical protein
MNNRAVAVNQKEKNTNILPSFRKHLLSEGIIRSDKGIRVEKEEGYIRCYYPDSEMIEEISSNGTKVRFSFSMDHFRKLESKNPRAAAIFYRYNAELFGQKSYKISDIARLYNISIEDIKAELYNAEKEVLKIIEICN